MDPANQPSPIELEILSLMATGLTDAGIAANLSISPVTVRIFIEKTKVRLGARTKAHAVAISIARRLIVIGPDRGS